MSFFSPIEDTINTLPVNSIQDQRKQILLMLIEYIQQKVNARIEILLNFICTHNSRRSQFSQIWAQTAADYYNVPAKCYSGGVEVTEFNPRAIASIERSGFKIFSKGEVNPIYFISYSENVKPIELFSKLYNDTINPEKEFASIMTCAQADDNCPHIIGAELRIPLLYDDPKEYDGTPEESSKYDERSIQIATEMFYVFSLIKL